MGMNGNGNTKRSLDEVLAAIKGSGGVKYVIAERLGVTRMTLDSYLSKWKTAEEARRGEESDTSDAARSVIRQNILLALRKQKETSQPVDSGDAWRWLRTKERDEFSERQEFSGPDSGPVTFRVVYDE